MQAQVLTFGSFVFVTGLVALGTYLLTRKDRHDTSEAYFLAGRSLSAGFVAGSLLLTNLSTEQLVGLNGDAFADGLSVIAWEVIAGMSLVIMALYFLPRYLKSGIATVPQFLEKRFNTRTRTITTIIFIVAYAAILLPMLLYTGASWLVDALEVPKLLGIDRTASLWVMIWLVGIIGSIYAIFGGLRTVAVSDTLNGFGLLVGGILITWLGLKAINSEAPLAALAELRESHPERFNSLGAPHQSVPFSTLFTGVLLLNLFYWCTNQQIIQRTFAAPSLAEGQKGVLLAGLFKLLAPIILVLPGIIAFHLYGRVEVDGRHLPVKDVTSEGIALVGEVNGAEVVLHGAAARSALRVERPEQARPLEGTTVRYGGEELRVERILGPNEVVAAGPDGENVYLEHTGDTKLVSPRVRVQAYGVLVGNVLPPQLIGFFAAVVVGAILSSFNSALNSTATLFSLGVYRDLFRPQAADAEVIRSGKVVGGIVAVAAMLGAPLLDGQESIFGYLQKMNGLYFIPIFSVVLVGMLTRRVPAVAANGALVVGFIVISLGYFVPPLAELVSRMHTFHFLGAVFVVLILLMLVVGRIAPRETPWVHQYSGDVDLTPWPWALPAGLGLVAIVAAIYTYFADLSAIGL